MGHTTSQCIGFHRKSQLALQQHLKYPNMLEHVSLSLTDIPPELFIYNIFPYLTYINLCSLLRVNKYFKSLIDMNDHLWERAIKTEILDESLSHEDSRKHQQVEQIMIFGSAKAKLICLIQERKRHPWIEISKQGVFGCNDPSKRILSHKYLTIRPSINVIEKEAHYYKLYVYISHGIPQHDFTPDMLDYESQRFIVGPKVEPGAIWCTVPTQSACLKCKSKCYYPPRVPGQPQPYTWLVNYFPKSYRSWRVELIEIYCGRCERFSLWKCETNRALDIFKPTKPRKNN